MQELNEPTSPELYPRSKGISVRRLFPPEQELMSLVRKADGLWLTTDEAGVKKQIHVGEIKVGEGLYFALAYPRLWWQFWKPARPEVLRFIG